MIRTQSWGSRTLCLLLCFVCFAGAVLPVAAVEEASDEVYETIRTSLIHNGPSAGSAVIGRMEDGTAVTVLGQRGDYYKIDCYDMTGYIACSQVQQRENGEYYIVCDPESAQTAAMECQSMADALLMRSAILETAQGKLGKPYAYGATGPNAFDCSGFTSYVYRQNGISLARMCSGQMSQSVIVSREGLQVGDLIFFGGSAGSVNHVGIYAGDGQIIHAGNSGICYAELDGAWCAQNYLCARRIITVRAEVMDPVPAAAVQSRLGGISSTGIRSAR